MERRYIWPFLLTWRLETCAFLFACDWSVTIWDNRQCVPKINTYWPRWFESWSQWKSLLIFWERDGKIYSQLTSWCQGITALQQMWSETGDLLYLSVPRFAYLCIWKSIEISEHWYVSTTRVTNTSLALGLVCKTLLFCVVKLVHPQDALRNLTVLFHRTDMKTPHQIPTQEQISKSCPTKREKQCKLA